MRDESDAVSCARSPFPVPDVHHSSLPPTVTLPIAASLSGAGCTNLLSVSVGGVGAIPPECARVLLALPGLRCRSYRLISAGRRGMAWVYPSGVGA